MAQSAEADAREVLRIMKFRFGLSAGQSLPEKSIDLAWIETCPASGGPEAGIAYAVGHGWLEQVSHRLYHYKLTRTGAAQV